MDKPFLMDILCTEQKILSIFNDMRHIVVRAIPPVPNIDILRAWTGPVPVHDGTESPEFVFLMDWLKQYVRVNVTVKIIKGIDMDAINPF